MSRSGYIDSDGSDSPFYLLWPSIVERAINGKRGQLFFRDLLEALDAMPVKRLITGELEQDGEVCAIGSLGIKRGINMAEMDPEESEVVAAAFNIADCVARDTVYMNDEWGPREETPEQRWVRMRAWVTSKIRA